MTDAVLCFRAVLYNGTLPGWIELAYFVAVAVVMLHRRPAGVQPASSPGWRRSCDRLVAGRRRGGRRLQEVPSLQGAQQLAQGDHPARPPRPSSRTSGPCGTSRSRSTRARRSGSSARTVGQEHHAQVPDQDPAPRPGHVAVDGQGVGPARAGRRLPPRAVRAGRTSSSTGPSSACRRRSSGAASTTSSTSPASGRSSTSRSRTTRRACTSGSASRWPSTSIPTSCSSTRCSRSATRPSSASAARSSPS